MDENDSVMRDLIRRIDTIKNTQEAVIDLLKVQGLITSEAFVIAFSNVVSHGLQDVAGRETNLRSMLKDAGLFKKL